MRFLAWFALALIAANLPSAARADEAAAVAMARTEGEAFVAALNPTALSIGIVFEAGALSVHVGARSGDGAGAPDDGTIYEIGSLTKTFTSTVLAHAVYEGRVALNDDIRKYLPPGFANLAWQGEPVRIVHLANLTSGLPNWLPNPAPALRDLPPEQVPAALIALHTGYDRTRFYADLGKVALTEKPGMKPRHSNVAAQLLADILERIYRRPYAALVSRYITQPLGMTATSFDAGGDAMQPGHDAKGRPMPLVSAMPDLAAAGGLRSSTHDMMAYLRYQLDHRDPAIRLSHLSTVRAPDDEIALNWHVSRLPSGQESLWHTGGTFGFSSYIVVHPQRQLAIVLMANESDPETQSRLGRIAGKIAEAYAAR